MFAWTGDVATKGNDFLAVIDADPASPAYGHLVTTAVTDQQTMYAHHTEYTMPASGMLFANDHNAGRTFIFDVNDPLHPKVATSFNDMAGYVHPHSYLRLPNGNVLATFQHAHHGGGGSDGHMGTSGGLVEINDQGKVVRSASNADPAFPDALLMPYGLVVLPEIDRVVSTNSSMHEDDVFRGVTYQLWRLSDLKLLKTEYFDVGQNRYAQISPEEPRLGPDGAIYVQTLGCGVERITGVKGDQPKSQLVYTFPGNWCGVPTIVGHYFVQSVPALQSLVRSRHHRRREAGGGLSPEARRHIQAPLDWLGRQDAEAGGDGRGTTPVHGKDGPGDGHADHGRRFPRYGWEAGFQLRGPTVAPRLEGVGQAPRGGFLAMNAQ